TGFDALTCRLDVLQTTVVNTPVDQVGGPDFQARLLSKLLRAHKMTDSARVREGRRLTATLRRIDSLLGGFMRGILRAEARAKLTPAVADRLLDLVTSAEQSVQALMP